MEKINIFVVSHKPLDIKKYPERKIIYVGPKHNCVADNIRIFTDSTNVNIAKLNPFYCEMTAQYWVWKNFPKSEYIGFEHYSRNFCNSFLRKASLKYLYKKAQKVDFLHIPRGIHPTSCANFWMAHEGKALFPIMEKSIKRVAPDYYDDWCTIMNGHRMSYCNMFICKWEIFDKYMSFVFKILDDCFNNMSHLTDKEKSRSIGYIAERLLDAFILHNQYKHKSCWIKIKAH